MTKQKKYMILDMVFAPVIIVIVGIMIMLMFVNDLIDEHLFFEDSNFLNSKDKYEYN